MNADAVGKGDVFQVSPETENQMFAGCLIIVSEVKQFGIQGYVTIPSDQPSHAYARVAWKDLAFVGQAMWVVE